MAEIVNLRRARKARARAERADAAAGNAARYGVTKAERTRTATLTDKARRDLDGHALDRPPEALADDPADPCPTKP